MNTKQKRGETYVRDLNLKCMIFNAFLNERWQGFGANIVGKRQGLRVVVPFVLQLDSCFAETYVFRSWSIGGGH